MVLNVVIFDNVFRMFRVTQVLGVVTGITVAQVTIFHRN